MTDDERLGMLRIIKKQAIKSNNDTILIDIKIDSFNFVIDEAIKALEQKNAIKCWFKGGYTHADKDHKTYQGLTAISEG